MLGLLSDKVRVSLASALVVVIAVSVVGVVASIRQANDLKARLAATGRELYQVKAALTDTQAQLDQITNYAPCLVEDMQAPVSRGFTSQLIVRIRECAGGYARVDARTPARVIAPRGPVDCVRHPCAWQMWLKSVHGEWRVFLMNEFPCPTRHVEEMSFPTKDFAKACEALGLSNEER